MLCRGTSDGELLASCHSKLPRKQRPRQPKVMITSDAICFHVSTWDLRRNADATSLRTGGICTDPTLHDLPACELDVPEHPTTFQGRILWVWPPGLGIPYLEPGEACAGIFFVICLILLLWHLCFCLLSAGALFLLLMRRLLPHAARHLFQSRGLCCEPLSSARFSACGSWSQGSALCHTSA